MQTQMPRHALLLPQLTISSKKKLCISYHGLQSPQRPDPYLDSWPPYHTLGSLLTVTAVLCHLCDIQPLPQLTAHCRVSSPQKPSLNSSLASLCPFPLAPTLILTLTGREFLLCVYPASWEYSPNTQTTRLPGPVNASWFQEGLCGQCGRRQMGFPGLSSRKHLLFVRLS